VGFGSRQMAEIADRIKRHIWHLLQLPQNNQVYLLAISLVEWRSSNKTSEKEPRIF
jgi:hypothetical protein